MKIATIELEAMSFYAFHGCYELEQQVGNYFNVELSYTYDISTVALTDDVRQAVNYLEVYQVVAREMAVTAHTLEHVADRLATVLLNQFTQMQSIRVKISKLSPPLGGKIERVSATLRLER